MVRVSEFVWVMVMIWDKVRVTVGVRVNRGLWSRQI